MIKKIHFSEDLSKKLLWGHWFLFFNVILILLIGIRYSFIVNWSEVLLARIYFIISLIGNFSVFLFCCYLFVIFPLSFIIKNIGTFINISCLFITLVVCIIIFDTEIYKQFKFHITYLIWDLLIDPNSGTVYSIWQRLFIPIPFILLIEIIIGQVIWLKIRFFSRQRWLKYFSHFCVLSFVSSHLMSAVSDAVIYRPITEQYTYFPFSYPMHAKQFLSENGFINLDAYNNLVDETGSTEAFKINYPRKTITYNQPKEKNVENAYNILLINISGMQQRNYTPEALPNLYQLAEQKGNVFTNNYSGSTSNAGAAVTLFYGIDANYLGSLLRMHKPPVFTQALQHNNYAVNVYSSKILNEYIFRNAIFKDLKYIVRSNLQQLAERWKAGLYDNIQNNRRWFNYVNFSIDGVDKSKDLQNIDLSLKDIFDTLEESNSMDKTVVIVTGNYVTKSINSFNIDELKSPLIIFWPDKNKNTYKKLTANHDIIATILPKILGVSNIHYDYTHGYDLFDSKHSWIMINNKKWNVVINENDSIYHLSTQGKYYQSKYDGTKDVSNETSLGILLQALKNNRLFMME